MTFRMMKTFFMNGVLQTGIKKFIVVYGDIIINILMTIIILTGLVQLILNSSQIIIQIVLQIRNYLLVHEDSFFVCIFYIDF